MMPPYAKDYSSQNTPYFRNPLMGNPFSQLSTQYPSLDSDDDILLSLTANNPCKYFRDQPYLTPPESPPSSQTIIPTSLVFGRHEKHWLSEYMTPPPSLDPKDIFSYGEPVATHSSTLSDSVSPAEVDDPFLDDSEGDDDDDDAEYVPSPKTGSRKRGHSTSFGRGNSSGRPAKRFAHTVSSSFLPSATPSPSPAPRKVPNNGRQHPPPRNKQVHINLDVIHRYNFVCPVEDCKWNDNHKEKCPDKAGDNKSKNDKSKIDAKVEASSRRLPDFKRHLISHMKPVNIKCPSCGKPFSRSDALVRHNRTAHSTYSTASNTRIIHSAESSSSPSPSPKRRRTTVSVKA